MRQVVLQMSVTLDGYVAGLGGELNWGLPAEHPEVQAWKLASVRQAGTHIMGRITYEEMAAYWPTATSRTSPVALLQAHCRPSSNKMRSMNAISRSCPGAWESQ
jgi:dihydrofolate reductase